MSDLYQFEDVGYFAEKAPAEGDRWRRVAVGAIIVVLALFLAVELVYYLIVVPATAPVNLTVQTSGSVGYDEVCAMAGITGASAGPRSTRPRSRLVSPATQSSSA
jgi:hypothetical protein